LATFKEVSHWKREEEWVNTKLTKCGKQLSEDQRLEALLEVYRLSPAVMTWWRDYCKATPTLSDQNLPDALAYISAQEPNIRASMTKQDIGFPSPLAAAATQQAPESL
jgi:hypothetical protein